jgi:hypothetical protein
MERDEDDSMGTPATPTASVAERVPRHGAIPTGHQY